MLNPDDLYPQELTTCADEPTVPPRPAPDQPRSDEDKATYTKDLRGAWADCHDTVNSVGVRKGLYKQQYDDSKRGSLGKIWHRMTGK